MERKNRPCIVGGCSGHPQGVRFPHPLKEPQRFYLWLQIIKKEDMLSSRKPLWIYGNKRICKRHFSENAYLPNLKKLKPGATPDLYLPGPNETPSEPSRLAMDDHYYGRHNFNESDHTIDDPESHSDPIYKLRELQIKDPTAAFPLSAGNEKEPLEFNITDPTKDNRISLDVNLVNKPTNFNITESVICGTSTIDDLEHKNYKRKRNTGFDSSTTLEEPVNKKRKLPGSTLQELGVHRAVQLSPRARILYTANQRLKKKLSRYIKKADTEKKKTFAARRALHTAFGGENKNIPEPLLSFMRNQIRLQGVKKGGHRFTLDDKLISLQILKRSGRAYNFLSKLFVLPSRRTLQRLLSSVSLGVGINDGMFEYLANVVTQKSDKMPRYKYSALMFDEMALCPHLNYNEKDDLIEGFQDLGEGRRSPQIADKGLVFMVRGLAKKYKQPVAYYFTAGTLNSVDLAMLLREVIAKLSQTGLTVVATVCDQATSNVAAIDKLCRATREALLRDEQEHMGDYFKVGDFKVIPLFDPPHLLKGLRNALLKHDIQFEFEGEHHVASWRHIQEVYALDTGRYRMLQRLTDLHVNPSHINKMKVKLAAQVFSNRVAGCILQSVRGNLIESSAKGTGLLCGIMDEAFDSVNGTSARPTEVGKPLRCAVSMKSSHMDFWGSTIKLFQSMFVIAANGRRFKTPSINNWVRTLRNIRAIWSDLQGTAGFKFLSVRNLNQDPLENKFGGIRSYGFRNNTPTCTHFMGAYKALLLNSMVSTQSVGSNCEADECSVIDNLRDFVKATKPVAEQSSLPSGSNDMYLEEDDELLGSSQPQDGYAGALALNYTAGYVLSKVGPNCTVCISLQHALCTSEEHALIKTREYDARRRLSYPSPAFSEIFARTGDVLRELLPKHCSRIGVGKYLRTYVASEIDFRHIACEQHQEKFVQNFCSLMVRLHIYTWIKTVNKIILGHERRISPDADDIISQAFNIYQKRCKYSGK